MGEVIVLMLLIPILFLAAFGCMYRRCAGGKKDAAALDDSFWMPLLIIAF